jgi:pyridine nucleotide-disulfide oxidoreductase
VPTSPILADTTPHASRRTYDGPGQGMPTSHWTEPCGGRRPADNPSIPAGVRVPDRARIGQPPTGCPAARHSARRRSPANQDSPIARKDANVMNQVIDGAGTRSRIVIVGAGYAGYHCARHLERRLPRGAAEIVIVSPADYMPYTSLLPQVGAGTVDPRHIAVSLSGTLRRTRHVPGHAVGVDFANRSLTVAGPDGQRRELAWHRLVLTPGSVSRTLPVPGILEQAKGFTNIAEALYLRNHVLGQLELADASDDPAQRQARCTFVVAGAGTTGTEVGAQGQLFTRAAPVPADPPRRASVAAGRPRPGRPARAGPAARRPGPAHPAPPRPRRAAEHHHRGGHRQPGPAL